MGGTQELRLVREKNDPGTGKTVRQQGELRGQYIGRRHADQ
jgi:hypothetical protein